MNNFIFVFISFFILITACTSSTPKSQTWSGDMTHLGLQLNEALPYIFDDEKFNDPKNKNIILERIKNFKIAASHITEASATKLFGNDPIVKNSVIGLNENLENAEELFKDGHLSNAQNILKSTVGFCYQCHTRTNFGAENTLKISDLSFYSIKDPVQRSMAYVATRQYEKALDDLKKSLMNDQKSPIDYFAHEKILKTYLSIAVKSDRPTATSIATLRSYSSKQDIPYYLKENIKSWILSLENWQTVKNKPMSRMSLKQKSLQTFDADYVNTLLDAQFYHSELLRGTKDVSKAYFELAKIYEKYPTFNYWDIYKDYYAACIMESPKTKIAQDCYKNLERAVYIDYSGTIGVSIPHHELLRLKIYRSKAGVP
jgi:hypothetical protein